MSVTPESGTEVSVLVGQLGRLSDRPELAGQRLEDISEELYTVQTSEDPMFCGQALVAAGRERVVATIEDDGVVHRAPEANSLITVKPCELVDDATITALPGFAGARREENPGGHQCYWETSPGDDRLSVRVSFTAGVPLGATSESVAGRLTVSSRFRNVGSAAFCTMETGHIRFTEPKDEPGVVEIAAVFVRVPAARLEAGCQAAKAVATALWPRLPAA